MAATLTHGGPQQPLRSYSFRYCDAMAESRDEMEGCWAVVTALAKCPVPSAQCQASPETGCKSQMAIERGEMRGCMRYLGEKRSK